MGNQLYLCHTKVKFPSGTLEFRWRLSIFIQPILHRPSVYTSGRIQCDISLTTFSRICLLSFLLAFVVLIS